MKHNERDIAFEMAFRKNGKCLFKNNEKLNETTRSNKKLTPKHEKTESKLKNGVKKRAKKKKVAENHKKTKKKNIMKIFISICRPVEQQSIQPVHNYILIQNISFCIIETCRAYCCLHPTRPWCSR